MELAILILVILVIASFIIMSRGDVNKDGKIDAEDVKAVADVNNDGKVDAEDVKVAVKKTKAAAKTAVKKVGTATRGRKPKKVT
jgi:hypothetical protein